jgi:hypothetical protein
VLTQTSLDEGIALQQCEPDAYCNFSGENSVAEPDPEEVPVEDYL